MQIQDVTKQAFDAIDRGDVRSSANLYADDFRMTGPLPVPLDKKQYLEVMEKLKRGIPDLQFHRRDIRVNGNTVDVHVQLSGTHTATLPSLMPGMPDVPPTNHSFRLPTETLHVRFQGDRIAEIRVDPVPGGGVTGILEQLGVSIPVTGRTDKPNK